MERQQVGIPGVASISEHVLVSGHPAGEGLSARGQVVGPHLCSTGLKPSISISDADQHELLNGSGNSPYESESGYKENNRISILPPPQFKFKFFL